jgi:hypothetical protein
LTLNPTLKVLSSMRKHGVHCLLMGGQACVFYGAAEFSRDVDVAVLADADNLLRLQNALADLHAVVIAVPPFEACHLHRGLAVHFRCQAPGVEGMRVDVMTHMRGVDPFPQLWERRTTILVEETEADLLSLPDLVKAKKTQRAKDWPMIQRLVEAHWFAHRHDPNPARVEFWLRECRSTDILLELVDCFPGEASTLTPPRGAVSAALLGKHPDVEGKLHEEQAAEVAADKAYWLPLRNEIERLRLLHAQKGGGGS